MDPKPEAFRCRGRIIRSCKHVLNCRTDILVVTIDCRECHCNIFLGNHTHEIPELSSHEYTEVRQTYIWNSCREDTGAEYHAYFRKGCGHLDKYECLLCKGLLRLPLNRHILDSISLTLCISFAAFACMACRAAFSFFSSSSESICTKPFASKRQKSFHLSASPLLAKFTRESSNRD